MHELGAKRRRPAMKSLFRRLGPVVDKALDTLVWVHECIMLFICCSGFGLFLYAEFLGAQSS